MNDSTIFVARKITKIINQNNKQQRNHNREGDWNDWFWKI